MNINDIEGVIRIAFYDAIGDSGGAVADPSLIRLEPDTVLLESGLDSLGFAILVSRLETDLGWDPFTLSDTPYYPQTFGEFASFYAAHQP